MNALGFITAHLAPFHESNSLQARCYYLAFSPLLHTQACHSLPELDFRSSTSRRQQPPCPASLVVVFSSGLVHLRCTGSACSSLAVRVRAKPSWQELHRLRGKESPWRSFASRPVHCPGGLASLLALIQEQGRAPVFLLGMLSELFVVLGIGTFACCKCRMRCDYDLSVDLLKTFLD